ncbi:MAG: hypothetical protein HYR60_00145 [Acidobacteria bacterium]|nr:hypothetical protein [Acidobacteriota bacterium]
MVRLLILTVAFWTFLARAADTPVYVVLWFDTEDYIEPSADDAALRLALDLEKLGVRATFKIVGEKARVLEARGRRDVIRALARHDIGYHAETHSIQPAPAVYLRELGWLEGAQEFERREGQGVADIRRLFGVTPSCYGQPGSSWGPQSYRALLRMGIPVYLDEGSHVRLDDQPFWFGGMLHVFGMGRFVLRASLKEGDQLEDTLRRFDEDAAELRRRGGGLISIYYHPTEFVTTEFWDGVNFPRGQSRERDQWAPPRRRTEEDSERCYRLLTRWVEHMKKAPDVRFVTARDLPQLYQNQRGSYATEEIRRHLAERQTFLAGDKGVLSAAEMLQILLGIEPLAVEGPAARRATTYAAREIGRPAFERAKTDVASFIRAHRRLPSEVWIGAYYLSLPDFAATLAGDTGGATVSVQTGKPEMERHIASDPVRTFNWVIHPEGFEGSALLELARLQAWTLKPARLR